MNITPKSIADKRTLALEDTWATRLGQLKSVGKNIVVDVDTLQGGQLDLFFEQLGVPANTFDLFSITNKKILLTSIMEIYRYSGTKRSVEKMCLALGAARIHVFENFLILTYIGTQARYDGLHSYDAGEQHRRQAVDITAYKIKNADAAAFRKKVFTAWSIFQPMKLFLNKVFTSEEA